MKVLLAQNDANANPALQSCLTKHNFEIVTAENQARVFELLESEESFHVVILDCDLISFDIAMVCDAIRGASSQYPYILLLAESGTTAAASVLSSGADDFLIKPVQESEFEIHLATAKRVAEVEKRLVIKAATDPLTGVLNRDAAILGLTRELARAQRNNSTLALLMLDLDRFKEINDIFGHQAGDALLREALYQIIETVRVYDSIGRYGGDEFLIMLPGCNIETACKAAERIRASVAKAQIEIANRKIGITASIGLVVTDNRKIDTETMIELADQALYRAKSGGRNRVEISVLPGPDVTKLLSVSIHDQLRNEIEQRKRAQQNLQSAEEALRQSQKWFQVLSEVGPIGIFRTDREGNCIYVNERWCEYAGLTAAEAAGKGWVRALHPDDRERIFHEWNYAVEAQVPFNSEYRFKKADGTVTWLIGHGVVVCGDAGETIGYIGTITDITERKRAELRQSALYRISEATNSAGDIQELYNTIHRIVDQLMDASNFYIALYDPATDLISFPYFIDEVDEAPPPRPAGKSLTAYVLRTKQTLHSTRENWEALLQTGDVELVGTSSLDWLGAPLTVGDDTFGVVVVQTYSETERFGEQEKELLTFVSQHIATALKRKKAEEALIQSERKFRTLVEESRDAIFISTPEGRLLDVNQAGVNLFGYNSKEELLQIDIARDLFFDPGDRENYRREFLNKSYLKDYELVLKRKDGQKLTTIETSSALTDENGNVIAFRGIIRDITHLKYLQEQLLQSQKMETVGRLAGGIAHDFNNLLMAITGYCDLIQLKYSKDQQLVQYTSEIQKAADRGSVLTRQLLAFGSKQMLSLASINLNHLIMDMDRMIERLLGEDIRLILKLDSKIGSIWGDAGQLEQVILNLVVNAKDAMPSGGLLIIETSTSESMSTQEQQDLQRAVGQYVVLTITDTGSGMSEATKTRIFEPFFSTKETGKGRGLGLSSVYGIVKQMNGFIEVQSQMNRGSIFSLYFKEADSASVAKEIKSDLPLAAQASAVAGNEVVLLVDDNETVRSAISTSLSMYGYKVLQAGCGEDAMKLCDQFPDSIHLMISDVVMPQMSGTELARQLLAKRPQLKVVLMSGYSEEAISANVHEDVSAVFLSKPVSAKHLVEKIRELLDA